MKKFLNVLLSVTSCFALTFGLTACSQNDASGHTHSAQLVAAKEAKCTEDGNSAYYVCDCGKWFSDAKAKTEITDHDSVVITMLGHDIQSRDAEAGTCTEKGCGAYEVCERDGCTYTTKVETAIDPNNHVPKIQPAKDPECTVDGNTAYYACDCGKWFSDANATTEITDHDSVVITQLGHDPQSHAAKAPTCSEVGWDAYETCKRDGCTYTTKVEKPTTAHDYWQSVCRNCHAIDPNATEAAGVQYAEVKENGQTVGYSVSRVSNYGYRRIPSEHDGLPVVSIGDNAFNNNRTMSSVEIPSSVKSIGAGAFADCGNLMRITFGGTKAEWNAITKGADWDSNTGNYTVYCSDGTITKAEMARNGGQFRHILGSYM